MQTQVFHHPFPLLIPSIFSQCSPSSDAIVRNLSLQIPRQTTVWGDPSRSSDGAMANRSNRIPFVPVSFPLLPIPVVAWLLYWMGSFPTIFRWYLCPVFSFWYSPKPIVMAHILIHRSYSQPPAHYSWKSWRAAAFRRYHASEMLARPVWVVGRGSCGRSCA